MVSLFPSQPQVPDQDLLFHSDQLHCFTIQVSIHFSCSDYSQPTMRREVLLKTNKQQQYSPLQNWQSASPVQSSLSYASCQIVFAEQHQIDVCCALHSHLIQLL